MDITFKITEDDQKHRFNYRVAAIIEADEKILIHKFIEADYCFLPGGRVKIGETAEAATIRELKEELDIDAKISGIPFIVENFFTYGDEKFHEVCLIFRIDGNRLELPKHEEIRGKVQFLWKYADDISDVNLQPEFLANALNNMPDTTQHIVNFGKN